MAEERDKLSADLMNKIREQRKLNRQQVRREIAAAVGAGAESFRTGRSAQGVFERWRPDYSDKMMSKKDKMQRSQDIYKQQEASEQYYFGQARMRAQDRANLLSKNRDREHRTALDAAKRKDDATYRRQTAIIKAQNNTVKNNNTELRRLEIPSDGAKAHFADMPTYEQRLDAVARTQLELRKEADPEGTYEMEQQYGSEKALIEAMKNDPKIREKASSEAKADAKRRIESMAAGNPEDKDLVWAVNEAAKKAGTNPAEIQQSLDVNTRQKTREADTNLTEEIDDINDEIETIDGAYERERRKIYQTDRETEEEESYELVGEGKRVMGSAEREARRIGASRAADVEDVPEEALDINLVTTEDLLRKEEQERIAEIGEDGEPVEEGEEEGFLGTTVKKPGPGAQAHFRSLLEVIEKFPESKPAQHAKAQIMASEDFKAYQKKNFGDTNVDSNVIWKEMVRDWRKQNRESMSEFRKKRREKRSREKAQEFDALTRPLREDPKKKVANVVQGASASGEVAPQKDARRIV